MNEELVDFFTSLLKFRGAIIEPAEGGSVQILAPSDVAASLGVAELFTASFDPEHSEKGILIAYGTPAIDSMISLLEKEGRFVAVSLPDLYVKSGNLDREIMRVFQFPRGHLNYLDSRPLTVSCLLFNFRYSAMSDERLENVSSIAVSESSLAVLEGMPEKLAGELPYALMAGVPETPAPFSPSQCHKKACKHLQQVVAEELNDFKKSMRHRLSRDMKRLHDYYEGMLRELERKRKKSSEASDETKAAQREAIHLEFNAKVQELKEKYSIKVTSRLFSACRVMVPASLSRMELRTGTHSVTMQFFWNALTRGFEPLVCSRCHGDTYEIFLNGGTGVLCRSCAKAPVQQAAPTA